MQDTVPFDVNEEVVVGDMTDVRQEIMPAAQNVRVRIDQASIQTNEAKDLKGLKLTLAIVEGVPVNNPQTGETELKYSGKKVFTNLMDLCFWANPETRSGRWFQTKQHMLSFKQFCLAVGKDIKNVKVNDEFVTELIGKEVLVNIVHEEETVKDEQGKRQKTGVLRERLKGWKRAE